jgi:hypothetical protein
MSIKSILLLCSIVTIQCSLPPARPNAENKPILSGTFYNHTFIAWMKDSIPGTMPYYCLSLTFSSSDSVEIENGIETFSLPCVISGDTGMIPGAYQTPGGIKDIAFIIINDSTLSLLDTAITYHSKGSEFIKNGSSFETLVNDATISGDYQNIKAKSTNSRVQFTSDGHVIGLSPYTSYEVCYAGDCLDEPLIPARVITLNAPDEATDFVYTFDQQKGLLSLFSLEAAKPDIQGERKVKDHFISLKRIKL